MLSKITIVRIGLPFKGPVFHVQSHPVDLCICSNEGKPDVGMTDCRNTITLNRTAVNYNCTIKYCNQTAGSFMCPFSHLDSAPGMIWTCGGMTYYHLDERDWRGCCYPALLSTGATVLTNKDIDVNDAKAKQHRSKRDIHNMLNRYSGYKTVSAWTSPWETAGWSLAGFAIYTEKEDSWFN